MHTFTYSHCRGLSIELLKLMSLFIVLYFKSFTFVIHHMCILTYPIFTQFHL
jgi:hypothetical protein